MVENTGSLIPASRLVMLQLLTVPPFLQEVNVKGTFLMSQAFLKAIQDAPSAPRTIIDVTSMAAQGFPPGMSSYSPSKIAVCKFTAYLAREDPDIIASVSTRVLCQRIWGIVFHTLPGFCMIPRSCQGERQYGWLVATRRL